jgi:integrase
MVDASLGPRASELLRLRWEDFDWKGLRVKIQGSWVYGRVELLPKLPSAMTLATSCFVDGSPQ